jgi:hypothetical protein
MEPTYRERVFAIATYGIGALLAAGGFALAVKLDVGVNDIWSDLSFVLVPCIVVVTAQRSERLPRWQTVLGVFVLACVLALALKANDVALGAASRETGFWGLLTVLTVWLPPATLLLGANARLIPQSEQLAIVSLVVGVLMLVATIAVGLHFAWNSPVWKPGTFLAFTQRTDFASLLVIASLGRLGVALSRLATWSLVVAGVLSTAAVVHAVWLLDTEPEENLWSAVGGLASWLTIVLLILIVAETISPQAAAVFAVTLGVALGAYAAWLASVIGPFPGDFWVVLQVVTAPGAFVLLALALSVSRLLQDSRRTTKRATIRP